MKAVRIAAVLGVTRGAASQWLKRYREQGIDSLYHRTGAKRPGKLAELQFEELARLLLKGAESFGYTGDVWTGSRIRELIETEFGVKFSVRHVQQLMKKLGWTPRKQVTCASRKSMEEVRL